MSQQHQPGDPVLTQQEQAPFEQHQSIIRMAAQGRGFRAMPLGGEEAIRAGLAEQNDPGWSMSDAPGAADGFRLTDLGTRLALAQGWRCQCAGCNQWRNRKGWSPAVTTGRVLLQLQGRDRTVRHRPAPRPGVLQVRRPAHARGRPERRMK